MRHVYPIAASYVLEKSDIQPLEKVPGRKFYSDLNRDQVRSLAFYTGSNTVLSNLTTEYADPTDFNMTEFMSQYEGKDAIVDLLDEQ